MCGKHYAFLFCVTIGILALARTVPASQSTLSYQGVLTDSSGAAVPDGAYTVIVTLWSLQTGGTRVWGPEMHTGVNTVRGAFTVHLGSITAFTPAIFQNYANLWLEVNADIGAGMQTYAPRVALAGAPWAIRASSAANADTLAGHYSADFAASAHSHSALDAADGAPTQAVVVDNAGNVGIKGNLDMAADGSNAAIINVTDPVNAQDAATKNYVDIHAGSPEKLVHTFTVAAGESIAAGDIVHLANGEIRKGRAVAPTTLHDATAADISVVTLSGTQIVVIFRDEGNSGFGTAILGAFSGSALTFSTEYVFNNAYTSSITAYALSDSQCVIGYRDGGNSDYATVIVGTLSGSAMTFGDETSLYIEDTGNTVDLAIAAVSDTCVVAAYTDGSTGASIAAVGAVSGTSVAFGAGTVYSNAYASYACIVPLSAAQCVLLYQDGGNSSYGTAILGAVSGSTISFGPATVFNDADTGECCAIALSETQFLTAYIDRGNAFYGTAATGAVSGSTLSFGPEAVFNRSATYVPSIAAVSASRFLVAYCAGDAQYAATALGDVSGTAISFTSGETFNALNTQSLAAVPAATGQCTIVYGPDLTTRAVAVRAFDTDLPLGIAGGSASAGQSIPVIIGGISPYHSGLIPGRKYVENLGQPLLGASGTAVGWAVSSSELLLDMQRD